MIRIDTITINGIADPESERRVRDQLTALLLSIRGTIPGSRKFGLVGDYLDHPMPAALGVLAVELSEACDEWIPNLSIQSVRLTDPDIESGEMPVTIEAEWRDSMA